MRVCERVSEWEGDTTQASVSVFQSACVFACMRVYFGDSVLLADY